MPNNRIDQEFDRLAEANTNLMNAIAETYDSDFDYDNEGEAKCNELCNLVRGLEKSEFNTMFSDLVAAMPTTCSIEEKTKFYAHAASEVSTAVSNYKWKNFGGGGDGNEFRVGRFVKIGGKFYYSGTELKYLNDHPNTVSYILLERFMRAPERFLSKTMLEAQIKGRNGTAKHRVDELRDDIERDISNGRRLIIPASRYTGYSEVNGFELVID